MIEIHVLEYDVLTYSTVALKTLVPASQAQVRNHRPSLGGSPLY